MNHIIKNNKWGWISHCLLTMGDPQSSLRTGTNFVLDKSNSWINFDEFNSKHNFSANSDQMRMIIIIYSGNSIQIVFNFAFKFSKLRSFVVECHFEICHPPDFASSGLFKQKKILTQQQQQRIELKRRNYF